MSEEKAHQREDILKDQIRHLVSRLKACITYIVYHQKKILPFDSKHS